MHDEDGGVRHVVGVEDVLRIHLVGRNEAMSLSLPLQAHSSRSLRVVGISRCIYVLKIRYLKTCSTNHNYGCCSLSIPVHTEETSAFIQGLVQEIKTNNP